MGLGWGRVLTAGAETVRESQLGVLAGGEQGRQIGGSPWLLETLTPESP